MRHREAGVWTIVGVICVLGGSLASSASLDATTTPAGKLEVRTVPAPSLAGNAMGLPTERRVSIYLPPGHAEGTQRFPTLYLLHGILDTDRTWTRAWSEGAGDYATIQDVMDRGIASGRIAEMIVVIPDADKSCHYTNSPLKGRWEDFLRRDLVDFVDREYRTLARTASRGIAGHSMGGHGAIKLGMKYPETFGVVYGLNPSLLGWAADVSVENEHFAALAELRELDDLAGASFYVQAIAGVGHCFSPNPDKQPFMSDFPFAAKDGKVVRSSPGFERWQSQMPLYMLDRYADNLRKLRGLRFDSAFVDEYSHIPVTNRAFSEALTAAGIAHTFEMYNGDHRNRLWGRSGRMLTEVLPYFTRLLEPAAPPAIERPAAAE